MRSITPVKIDLNPWVGSKAPKIPLLRQEHPRRGFGTSFSARKRAAGLATCKKRLGSCSPILPTELLHQIQTLVKESRRNSPEYGDIAALRTSHRTSKRHTLMASPGHQVTVRRRKPGGLFPLRTHRTPEGLPSLEISSLVVPTQGRSCPSLDRVKPLLKETVNVVLALPQVLGDTGQRRKSRIRKSVETRVSGWETKPNLTVSGDWDCL